MRSSYHDTPGGQRVTITVAIKALNEEDNIEKCLTSALAAVEGLSGEVLLIDSISTDRTVEVSSRFPVRIVQFCEVADRSCGAAAQLAYQFSQSDYFLLIDGDMTLERNFVHLGLRYLESNSDVAGVGGIIVDSQVKNAADERRMQHYSAVSSTRTVPHLGGGGLYRRSSIEKTGYFSHRWLKACEEAELGVRLAAKGFRLTRLPVLSIKHTGHDETTPQMLARLWRNRRMHAYGAFVRTAIGKAWWWLTLRQVKIIFIAPLIFVFSAIFAGLFAIPSGYFARFVLSVSAMQLSALVAMSVKKGSVREGFYSIVAWHMYSLAAISGFLVQQGDPLAPIEAKVVK